MIFKNHKIFIAIIIALSTCFADISFSNKKLKNEDCFLLLQQAEKKISAEELCELARCYIFGKGAKKAPSKAIPLLERSAKLGSSNALNMLGIMYKEGLGVEKDHNLALRYFYAAEKKDNTFAQYNLGMYYYKGRIVGSSKHSKIVDRDYKKAVHWLKIASDKGYSYAQAQLGICYYEGKGVPHVDYNQAIHLFQRASNQGNALGTHYLAKCYEQGNGVQPSGKRAFKLYYLASMQNKARYPYLIALTNMLPNQVHISLLILNILIGLRYPWIAPIPKHYPSFLCIKREQSYFIGRILISLIPTAIMTKIFIQLFGFCESDKFVSYGIIASFFYAFCSLIIHKFEMQRHWQKQRRMGASLKDGFYEIFNILWRFIKRRLNL